jgi:glucose/arabinose dehydrogenase
MQSRSISTLLAVALLSATTLARAVDPDISLELVTTVDTPVYLTHAGDERLFIVEQPGSIRIYTEAQGLRETPFLDIRNKVGFGGERGLFSVAFHPDYANNGFFYVAYTNTDGSSVIERYAVSSGDEDLADPNSGRTLLVIAQPFANHNGGQLQFSPDDGYLYVGMGDGGSGGDPACRAQRSDTPLGKILRIDVDQNVNQPPFFGIPTDNPFAGTNDPADLVPDEVWAFGLRNPWRFSFDRLTGDLFMADVGQSTREEVDLQPTGSGGGENYGWKVMEGDYCFDPDPIDEDCPTGTPSCFDAAYTAPIHVYPHQNGNCSITGGYVYRGSAIPSLQARYLFGDYCTTIIWALEETMPGVWAATELLHPADFGLTSFGEDRTGELYVTIGDDVFRLVSGDSRIDVDGNGVADALTDGLLIIRRLFGFDGEVLTDGAVGAGCTRCDAAAIAAYIDQIRAGLDVDGNGQTDALTDGLLIIRYLFGFTGTALTDGAVGDGCTRCTAAEISTYCATLVP